MKSTTAKLMNLMFRLLLPPSCHWMAETRPQQAPLPPCSGKICVGCETQAGARRWVVER